MQSDGQKMTQTNTDKYRQPFIQADGNVDKTGIDKTNTCKIDKCRQ